MTNTVKKLDLKKIKISRLDHLHLIIGGSYPPPENSENASQCECPHTIVQSKFCERDTDIIRRVKKS